MASTRIPLELFDDILAYVWNVSRRDLLHGYKNAKKRRRALRYLSDCSSVCVYWANFIRPRMFHKLVLRSAQDLYGLLALLRMPSSSYIYSIAHCLRAVAVFYRLEDYFWCHSLQRLQASGAREKLVLRIHISGRAPCVRNKERTVRHPLFHTIPRMVPFHRQPLLYVDLIINGVSFPDGAGLFNLIRDINNSGILPRSVRCKWLVWDDGFTISRLSLYPIFPLNQHPHAKPFDVTTAECTDNYLVAFAMHSCIGRRGRDAVMLSFLDASRLLRIFDEWAKLTGEERLPIRSRVIHTSPLSGREGDNRVLKADQGMTGYLWRIDAKVPVFPLMNHNFVDSEFGYYVRPLAEQGHGLGNAQTAYIFSIVINIHVYDRLTIRQVDWKTVLYEAMELPMLDTIEVSVQGWDELQHFVHCYRETLAVVESRGRLRLCLLEGEGHTVEDEYRRQVDLSDVPVIDRANTDEDMGSGSEDWRQVSDVEIESERSSNEDIRRNPRYDYRGWLTSLIRRSAGLSSPYQKPLYPEVNRVLGRGSVTRGQ